MGSQISSDKPSSNKFANASLVYMLTVPQKPVKEVAAMTRRKQLAFADPITKKYSTDAAWVEEQLNSFNTYTNDQLMSSINDCSIGNLAYLCLYAPTNAQRAKAEAIMQNRCAV